VDRARSPCRSERDPEATAGGLALLDALARDVLAYCLVIAMRYRSSGEIKWSASFRVLAQIAIAPWLAVVADARRPYQRSARAHRGCVRGRQLRYQLVTRESHPVPYSSFSSTFANSGAGPLVLWAIPERERRRDVLLGNAMLLDVAVEVGQVEGGVTHS
jgi:hypothetical protein